MRTNTREFHKLWLKVTAVVVGSFGPVFLMGSMLPTSAAARFTLTLISLKPQTFDDPTTRFLSALAGGFLLGWGVTIWCLQQYVYDACADGVRRSVLYGVLAWVILDSVGSIASGNPSNVLFNDIVLLLAVGPLWMPAAEDSCKAK